MGKRPKEGGSTPAAKRKCRHPSAVLPVPLTEGSDTDYFEAVLDDDEPSLPLRNYGAARKMRMLENEGRVGDVAFVVEAVPRRKLLHPHGRLPLSG